MASACVDRHLREKQFAWDVSIESHSHMDRYSAIAKFNTSCRLTEYDNIYIHAHIKLRTSSDLGVDLGSRRERSKLDQVTFVYRQVGFVWHRLFLVKSTSQQKNVSCTCSPSLLLILYLNCLNHSPK